MNNLAQLQKAVINARNKLLDLTKPGLEIKQIRADAKIELVEQTEIHTGLLQRLATGDQDAELPSLIEHCESAIKHRTFVADQQPSRLRSLVEATLSDIVNAELEFETAVTDLNRYHNRLRSDARSKAVLEAIETLKTNKVMVKALATIASNNVSELDPREFNALMSMTTVLGIALPEVDLKLPAIPDPDTENDTAHATVARAFSPARNEIAAQRSSLQQQSEALSVRRKNLFAKLWSRHGHNNSANTDYVWSLVDAEMSAGISKHQTGSMNPVPAFDMFANV